MLTPDQMYGGSLEQWIIGVFIVRNAAFDMKSPSENAFWLDAFPPEETLLFFGKQLIT